MNNKSFGFLPFLVLIVSATMLTASNSGSIKYMIPLQQQLSVQTSAVYDITSTSAMSGYVITGSLVPNAKRGICLSGKPAPTITNTIFAADKGMGTAFNVSMTGLRPGTKCYIKAYVTTSTGTIYGNEVSFTTAAAKK
jgi:hypothetical protein